MLKRILGSDAVRRVLCWVGAQYVRFVYLTGRWSVVRGEIPAEFWQRNEPFIACFWHGRLLMMPSFWGHHNPPRTLISQHRDGQIIARTAAHLGMQTIAGSTRKGGAGALRAMLRVLRDGACVAIAPDGPRGPRMRASDGIVALARLSGAAILPVAVAANRRKVLNSWDRFIVTWPFARGGVVWGEPIRVARDADAAQQEAARAQVEAALNAITAEADELAGVAPIEPAPQPTGETAS